MSGIKILPEKVASQIAAGEVIERPASVVRELLDNSVDAGADRINIRIENGGKRLIRFSDNGVGMDKDDMLLSLERHATSKISSVSDLFSIETLGFRGEALASIFSVSRMELTSRPEEQLVGYRLKSAGGRLKSIDETGAPAGTTVEVRDLFYNLPARRKFLRAARTETGHIVDTLSRIVLPFTNIQLRLDDTGKSLLNLPASENQLNRLTALLGRKVAASMTEVYQETDGVRLSAYLAPSDLSRSRGDRIYVYINSRNIRDRLLTHAIMEGYGQRLMKGRYPQVVVYIEIDPSLVDVNVHPTKQEVRFHESRLVYDSLVSFIQESMRNQFRSFSDPLPGYHSTGTATESQSIGPSAAEPAWEYSQATPIEVPIEKPVPGIGKDKQYLVREAPQVIGQLRDTYILCQTVEGLLLIDQHAAHERIVYEALKRSYHSTQVESQAFLIPRKLELSLKEGRVVLRNLDQLSRLGLEIEHFGGNSFLVRSVPSVLVDVKWEEFLLDLLPVMEEEGDLAAEKALDRLWTVISCHSAIRAGQRMSHSEIIRLLEQLEEMDLPTNCPHGRPIFRKFSYHEIEKMFKRVV
ncbi:MAG: DNA mismatch repair endonuclease MutL [Deltaproteobacteria bacterium]|nr:DNA mismatch repair endonuclease MutL [Deltaproteobacteria bacterium]